MDVIPPSWAKTPTTPPNPHPSLRHLREKRPCVIGIIISSAARRRRKGAPCVHHRVPDTHMKLQSRRPTCLSTHLRPFLSSPPKRVHRSTALESIRPDAWLTRPLVEHENHFATGSGETTDCCCCYCCCSYCCGCCGCCCCFSRSLRPPLAGTCRLPSGLLPS